LTSSLTVLTFLPLVFGVLLLLIPETRSKAIHLAGVVLASVVAILSVLLFLSMDRSGTGLQLVEKAPWIPSIGVYYHVGIDGISILLYLLTAILTPLAILAAYGSVNVRVKEFVFLLLALETCMLGTLVAANLFLFYVFWELMLIPMALLIGIWGGPRRIYATVKFVLFTVFGSLPMLLGILYLSWRVREAGGQEYLQSGLSLASVLQIDLTAQEQIWLFLGFFLSFAIKLPLFPFHTWLPDAHTEAPTAGSVVLAGVLLKMGGYGLLRYAIPVFPFAADLFTPYILVLGAVGIVHGALVALAQTDVKRLIAYSSVSHMGLVAMGLFSGNTTGVNGALYQMLAHGLSTGALFVLVGVIYERRHTREVGEFGGLARPMPWYAAAFLWAALASAGLPGLCGFVGEFLSLLGIFARSKIAAAFAATGLILGAWYMLLLMKKMFFGEVTNEENEKLQDLGRKEIGVLAPMLLLMVLLGVYPSPFLSRSHDTVDASVTTSRARAATMRESVVRKAAAMDEASDLSTLVEETENAR